MFHDQPEPARRHARAAIARLSGRDEHRPLLTAALLLLFFNEVRAGGPAPTELLDRALALEAGEPSFLAGSVPAIWWKSVDDHDRARARLHLMLDLAVARGDDPLRHEVLTHLGETELLAGRFAEAGSHIAAARDLGEQLGTGLVGESWLGGVLDAHRGRLARAAPPPPDCAATTTSPTRGAGDCTTNSPGWWRWRPGSGPPPRRRSARSPPIWTGRHRRTAGAALRAGLDRGVRGRR
nr:hypothetical protein [Micromonospora provocatoris]